MADIGSSASGSTMWCSIPEKLQLHAAMLALQFGYAGFHVVSRAALNMGISKLVFLVYRNIIAFLLLLPFAYFLEKYTPFLSFSLSSLCFPTPTHYFMFFSGRNALPFLSISSFNSSFLPSLGMPPLLPINQLKQYYFFFFSILYFNF